jgi:sugar-specific transcriptional regulator TrmB
MLNKYIKFPSPQAIKVYRLLENGKPMSAKQIGHALKIFPNAVYREVKQLQALGFIEETFSYPIKFKAKNPSEALELYSLVMRQNFFGLFGNTKNPTGALKISFYETRKDMLKFSDKDTARVKNQMNFILSGHEVPAETYFSFKKARERGVEIRVLVQNIDKDRREMLKNWQKIGIKIRCIPEMNARVLIFDENVTSFASYNPKQRHEAFGVRFDYPPFAKLMNDVFEQKWKTAKEMTGF